jgi:hypothetical protein
MQSKLAMHLSKRCKAKSKRSGKRCNNAAVRGWSVCRMHGVGGGAPKGKANGNYKHGFNTQEAEQDRKLLREAIRVIRRFAGDI